MSRTQVTNTLMVIFFLLFIISAANDNFLAEMIFLSLLALSMISIFFTEAKHKPLSVDDFEFEDWVIGNDGEKGLVCIDNFTNKKTVLFYDKDGHPEKMRDLSEWLAENDRAHKA